MLPIDADVILDRLDGLPLALTQAGSYIQETNMSAFDYAKHYDSTWERLMQSQGQLPLEEYGDRNVLTTWMISYEQVQKQSEEAAWLLKLWGFLDHGELWYELVAAGSKFPEDIDTPTWLLEIAEDELAYTNAVGLLSRYSLADAREDSNSHSMHSVLHRWCKRLAENEERYDLGCIAAGIVALNAPSESEAEFWKKRRRLLVHAIIVSGWIVGVYSIGKQTGGGKFPAWIYHNLGHILAGEVRFKEAEAMLTRALQGYEEALGPKHISTLSAVWRLGILYADQGKLAEAEVIYTQALQGYKEALGPKHTSTLQIVGNLGILYRKQGKLAEAEVMYTQALQGCKETLSPELLLVYLPALNTMWGFGDLFSQTGRKEMAKVMYSQALAGYTTVQGPSLKWCRQLEDRLQAL